MTKEKEKNKLPEKVFRVGGVKATVWLNENKDKETYYSVSLIRSYKDKEDEWQETNSYTAVDVPKVVAVMTAAYNYIAVKDEKVEAKED